jgi:hypothetical protein
LTLLAVALDCGKRVMIPPRIDLKDHEVIGIIEFKCSNEGKLAPLATRRFTEAIRADQGMVRIVDLGTEKDVLKAVNQKRLDQDAFKAIGEKYGVSTIFAADLIVSDVRPKISITPGFGVMSFSAEVAATLAVRMVEAASGASVWNSSADARQEVGGVTIFGGKAFAFNADDPDEAYGDLVDALVYKTTRDFRVTWERR